MKLGEIIYRYRKDNALTMQEFATRCGKSKGYISMLESGKNPKTGKEMIPTLQTYSQIAGAMRMSLNELLRALGADSKVLLSDADMGAGVGTDLPPPIDAETLALAREIAGNPDMRALLDAGRDASPDDMRKMVGMAKIMGGVVQSS